MKKKPKNIEESKSEESEKRHRHIFENSKDGILILDSETGQIIDVNPFLERLLGYSRDELLTKKLWEVGAFNNITAAKDIFQILQKDAYVHYEDLPLIAKEGALVDVEFVSNPYDTAGIIVIQFKLPHVNQQKKVDLIKESKRLLDDEKHRVESIADATHELRTPIAIIKGNVDLAIGRGGHKSKSAISALRAIDNEIKHLSIILSDLSLITSKAWELKNRIIYEKVNLRNLALKVAKRCRPLAHKKKITIKTTEVEDLTILGDKIYLEKMLVNLVKNSIVYGNKNGHTEISVKKSNVGVTISVADDGIGIGKDDLPRIFERFYRAGKSHSIDGRGVGLGLAIVKWVAELHGGEVNVSSQIGAKGSIFSVTLPSKNIRKI